jgi:hypothetical protein
VFYRLLRVEMTSSGCALATHRCRLSFALPKLEEQFESCGRVCEVYAWAVARTQALQLAP